MRREWLLPTPALGDEEGLEEARAARSAERAAVTSHPLPGERAGGEGSVDGSRAARRRLIAASLAGLALAGVPPAARSQGRAPTPRQTAGPFYPREFPADDDNDLVSVKGRPGIAKGEILLLAGVVVDTSGKPVAGARVEIWQCNAFGRYHHPGDNSSAPLDPAFQGWGQFVTGADGAYRFRTIRPVPYPGRTPHIHFRVTGRGIQDLVTQMYVEGEPGNERDGIYGGLDPRERAAVTVRLDRAADGNALAARFEIVVRA